MLKEYILDREKSYSKSLKEEKLKTAISNNSVKITAKEKRERAAYTENQYIRLCDKLTVITVLEVAIFF